MRVILLAMALTGCGARVLEVKTKNGGFCFLCIEKPDRATLVGVTGSK
jgi:hypothetical protein